MLRRALTAAALALLAPATAHAAYAPKLSVQIDPTTPRAAPAVTSTITQASGETASKTVQVAFPKGFSPPTTAVQLQACSSDQEANRACPAESKMGDAEADASPGGHFTGTVDYGGFVNGKTKLIVFLSNGISLFDQTIEGFVEITPNGFVTTFDNLPNVLTTSFVLKLDGAPRSLLTNPAACGQYTFTADFTSQQGEKAGASSPVQITDCPLPPLRIDSVRLARSKIRRGRSTTLRIALSEPASVVVTVRRPSGARLKTYVLDGQAGANRLRGIGRGLRAGRYRVDVRAITTDGRRARTRHVTLRIVRRP